MSDIIRYYTSDYDEQSRLSRGWGQLEFVRTQRLIRRDLKPPPAVVLDVGGASGRYAAWLAREGYQVHLLDPVPLHIEQARAASAAQPERPIASCELGDARTLAFPDNSVDAVLLMGPLYHLVDAQDRQKALSEAFRVLRVGGLLFAVGISRFASSIDGLVSGSFIDPVFQAIMLQDLENGQHRNPTRNPAYFTDTFFHHPDELQREVEHAGFQPASVWAVEGIGYMARDIEEQWQDESRREFMLDLIERTGQERTLLGASPHLMCVGAKGIEDRPP